MEAATLMLENRTTITIPDGNKYWGNCPDDAPGEYKLRIEGFKVNRKKKKAQFHDTIVDSPGLADLSMKGIVMPCGGPTGLYTLIYDLPAMEAFRREEEWIPLDDIIGSVEYNFSKPGCPDG